MNKPKTTKVLNLLVGVLVTDRFKILGLKLGQHGVKAVCSVFQVRFLKAAVVGECR